mmetsp:Transcript_54170/g.118659  ORF Transcript_54170/g.118659 Transcript_54170/m.118659 type:complete len:169 (+) Transcript_54170:49-555(+)
MDLDYEIRAAQRQACRRAPRKQDSLSYSPAKLLSLAKQAEIDSRVRDAQLKAQLKLHEPSMEAPPPMDALAPEDLLGVWTDSHGNAVSVYSTDAYKMSFVATLSRPPRRDIHLTLRRVSDGAGWCCGDALLGHFDSFFEQLSWVFPNGMVSLWIRKLQEAGAEVSINL